MNSYLPHLLLLALASVSVANVHATNATAVPNNKSIPKGVKYAIGVGILAAGGIGGYTIGSRVRANLRRPVNGFIHAEQTVGDVITSGPAREGTGYQDGTVGRHSPFDFYPKNVFQHVKTEGFARIWDGIISPDPETAGKQWVEIRSQLAHYPKMRTEILSGLNLDSEARASLDRSLGTDRWTAVGVEKDTYIKREAQLAADKEAQIAAQKAKEKRSLLGRSKRWVKISTD